MTDFVPFPHHRFHLPEGGKVTGTYVLVVRGDTALVLTEGAHVNDDNPAIEYRGKSYLVHLELQRVDGKVSFVAEHGYRSPREAVSKRGLDYPNTAPPSFSAAICEAIRAHAEEVWTDEVAPQGYVASTAQALHSTEREYAEAEKQFAEVKAQLSMAAGQHLAAKAAAAAFEQAGV